MFDYGKENLNFSNITQLVQRISNADGRMFVVGLCLSFFHFGGADIYVLCGEFSCSLTNGILQKLDIM